MYVWQNARDDSSDAHHAAAPNSSTKDQDHQSKKRSHHGGDSAIESLCSAILIWTVAASGFQSIVGVEEDHLTAEGIGGAELATLVNSNATLARLRPCVARNFCRMAIGASFDAVRNTQVKREKAAAINRYKEKPS